MMVGSRFRFEFVPQRSLLKQNASARFYRLSKSTLSKAVVAICAILLADSGVCQSERSAASGSREITRAEAHDLLRAFLKLPGDVVEESGDLGYKQFDFFMAIFGSSRPEVGDAGVLQVRYYAVDRQTGDVWNSVICQRMATRLLKRL